MPRVEPKSSVTSINAAASEWLTENLESLASAITVRSFGSEPKPTKNARSSDFEKCEEDAMYHLHYLAEAIAVDSPKMFLEYVGWAKIMLASRGISFADLAGHLQAIDAVLQLKAPKRLSQLIHSFVEAASAALPEMPETLPSFIDSTNPHAKLANSYLNSLLLLNREEAISAVISELESGLSFTELFQNVISPVQREVGRLWQQNRITVVQEHYCTAATDLLITRSRRNFLGNRRNVSALAVCADGEEHCLGIRIFSDLLESDGWKVSYIGPKCPVADVLKHLQANFIDLLAISVASPLNLAKVRKLIAEIKKLPQKRIPAIMVGGAVLNSEPDLWKRIGADGSGANVLEGLEVANTLIAQRTSSESQSGN